MRLILVVVGILMVLAGLVWVLQGTGVLLGSFMSNDSTWTAIGAATGVVGVVLAVFGIRTGPSPRSP